MQNILRGSAQKARLVIDMIRGKNVNQALAILRFSNKRAATRIEKCMQFGDRECERGGGESKHRDRSGRSLGKDSFVDHGPTKNRRRMRPAPQGRAYREQRHYCHITILVSSDDKPRPSKS